MGSRRAPRARRAPRGRRPERLEKSRATKVYVTGASGFVGGHVVRELRERGADVREDFVDLLDVEGLERATSGCDAVFHLAALYSYDADAAAFELVNVRGTLNVVRACVRSGVRRLVHTSTAGTCGPVPGRPATEADAPPDWELEVPYKRTKLEAERIAVAAARDGELDAVVVNPTTPVGEGDHAPTPTGEMIARAARGQAFGYLATTGLNLVDVRDVARGHLLALERGRRGERYLLGGENLPLREVFDLVAGLARARRPRLRVPYAVAAAAARLRLVNAHEVRLARLPMYFSSEKAERELGYRPGPIGPALRRAVADVLGSASAEARAS